MTILSQDKNTTLHEASPETETGIESDVIGDQKETLNAGKNGGTTSVGIEEQNHTKIPKTETARETLTVGEVATNGDKNHEGAISDVEEIEEGRGTPVDEIEEDDPKTIHWKNSPFAVGRVNATWEEEREGSLCCRWRNTNAEQQPRQCKDIHLQVSGVLCTTIKAGRVGNMAVLAQTKSDPPKILVCAGPLWMVTVFLTGRSNKGGGFSFLSCCGAS